MTERIQAVRGMNDILPEESCRWRFLTDAFARCLIQYGYKEIKTPLLESTQLFKRTIGEVTDIVEKEMYTFTDLNGDSLTLRPEGTAGCVRACLEHGLLHNQQQKLWYCGPMFRHEKPQKGRYRQFYQFGVEALGIEGIGIELELISICQRLWQKLGLGHAVELEINTLGELEERQVYREQLVSYFEANYSLLDEDSKKRLLRNPLRILDSKNPDMQSLISAAPKLIDVISERSKSHFFGLCAGLEELGINYTINPFLVRGLDYYGHTVFEWVTGHLGSQGTVCAGGRYDGLIEQIGGNPTPAVGFAIGLERLLLLQEKVSQIEIPESVPDIFFIAVGDEAVIRAVKLAEKLRNDHGELQIIVNTAGGSFKSQFKKADKSRARLALILGSDEIQQGKISIKNLREPDEQKTIPQQELGFYIQNYLQ
ncbi:histidine--tRNA ligase [Legionella londiniensis]|uniref:Histidine--tRNA ligase n=1 Tax=Legionella londiniensis TaxID=45068 RepID=A0A0W0VMZ3_9GAMM|nr:histidine--tRNA ligase [Legionella londiniensis]KTD21293.1 histidyl-tRNA synthetase [Legionella londiniensis]STX93319.1 histidyl-tRNA synthetase [Legionella londiniensis]